MPRLTVRLTPDEDARLRAAAELRRVPVSDLLRAGVRAVVADVLARAGAGDPAASSTPSDARAGRDRRRRREAYTDGDVATWAGAIAEHGERRAGHWPERRGPRP